MIGSNAIGSNAVQIMNSTFGPGGCSDGIQDSSKGTEIGPNNEFKNITQSCSAGTAHVDSIQVYASNYVWIHDNYIHDGEQGIMSPDGPSTGYRIENNVIHTSTGYPCMHFGDNRDSTISHNVCRNGAIRLYGGNQGVSSQNITAQNTPPDKFQQMRTGYAQRMGGLPIVGDPDHIASQLIDLSKAGLTGVAVSLVNYVDELPFFCEEVLPRLERAGLREKRRP